MHLTIKKSIDPICNNTHFSLNSYGLLTAFNTKAYLTNLNTYESKLIVPIDSHISSAYLKDDNLFISVTNSIIINNLRVNFYKKVLYFNVINDYLILSFFDSTLIFEYKMNKITTPYTLCNLNQPINIDYYLLNEERINEYLTLVTKYDFVTSTAIYTNKLILGDNCGNIHSIDIMKNKEKITEEISKATITSILSHKNNLYILDNQNNLFKNSRLIRKNIVGISVKNDMLIYAEKNGLFDLLTERKVFDVKSNLITYRDSIGITDEFEILINNKLLIGNNDEVTDIFFVKFSSTDKDLSNFDKENHNAKKLCTKEKESSSLAIATNSGRLRIFRDNTYNMFYDHTDSIICLGADDDLLFSYSRDETLCIYYKMTLVLKITELNLLSFVLFKRNLYAIGGNKLYWFKIDEEISHTFMQVSFSKIDDTFIKMHKVVEVTHEISYLSVNDNIIAISHGKEMCIFNHQLKLIKDTKINKKVNVIALNNKYLFSCNKTFRMHDIKTLDVIKSQEFNAPIVSICLYKENILLGDANGWIYCLMDDKVLFKRQIHKDRIWCIKYDKSNDIIITGSADGVINYLINDTEEHEERLAAEETKSKQIKLDVKVLKENKNYKLLIEKMLQNNLPGIEKELLNYFYLNNKSLDDSILSQINDNLIHNKMNLKYLELINYLNSKINYKIKDNLVKGMDDLFKELTKNKNKR